MNMIGPVPAGRASKFILVFLPFFAGICCVVLGFIPFGSILGLQVTPAFGLMAVFFWAVNKPESLPPLAVFGTGLLYDLLSAGPVGLWALLYLVAYGVVQDQRVLFTGRSRKALTFGFALTALAVGVLSWGIVSFYHGVLVPVGPVLWQMIVSVVLFPLFAALFFRFQTLLVTQGEQHV